MANPGKHPALTIASRGLARSTRRPTKAAPQIQEAVIPLCFLGNGYAELRGIRLAVDANRNSHVALYGW